MAQKLFSDPFLLNQNWVYLWINMAQKPFSNKSKLSYLWINSLKVLYSLFLLYANVRAIEI